MCFRLDKRGMIPRAVIEGNHENHYFFMVFNKTGVAFKLKKAHHML